MEPTEAKELELGTAVWVWIVRFGKGRWWPGAVQRVEAAGGLPIVKVRLQSLLLSQHRNGPPITVGFVSAPMRRLERRDLNRRALIVPNSCRLPVCDGKKHLSLLTRGPKRPMQRM